MQLFLNHDARAGAREPLLTVWREDLATKQLVAGYIEGE